MTDPLRAIREAFDRRAPHYDDGTMHRAVAATVADFIDLDGVTRVVDVASGTGLVLRALYPRAPHLALTGTDISPGMLDIARTTLPEAEWIEADAATLPFADSSVDVVTCVTALHIIPTVPRAAVEWRRVLRPGGRLVTATFSGSVPEARAAPHGASEAPYPRHHAPYAYPAALANTFEPFGFRLTRHTEWSDGVEAVLIAELDSTDESVDPIAKP